MAYRPPSQPPKGAWARHIHAVRRERDWSQTQGFEHAREGLHLGPKSRNAYIALDMGTRDPNPDEEEALAAVYGWPPEDESPAEVPEGSDPILTLATAITGLTQELRAARLQQVDATDRVLRAIAASVAGRVPPGMLDPIGAGPHDELR